MTRRTDGWRANIELWWRSWRPTFLLLFALLVVRSSLADHYMVPSGSMEPTIQVGDRLMVNKMAYDLRWPFTDQSVLSISEPRRGDVVVFTDPQNGITMVKRLVGLPGDHLEIVDGLVRVNGKPLQKNELEVREAFFHSADNRYRPREILATEKITGGRSYQVKHTPSMLRTHHLQVNVPEGQYFMMGDNRDNSLDSRSWGFVPRANLLGRAHHVLFSAKIVHWPPVWNGERIGLAL